MPLYGRLSTFSKVFTLPSLEKSRVQAMLAAGLQYTELHEHAMPAPEDNAD
jgi:hypothetical protein